MSTGMLESQHMILLYDVASVNYDIVSFGDGMMQNADEPNTKNHKTQLT